MNLKQYRSGVRYIGLFIVSFFLINLALFGGHQDVTAATKTLETNNYKPIKVGGYGWFKGDKDDIYITKFTALSPNGEIVKGVVTSGWFKPNEITIDKNL